MSTKKSARLYAKELGSMGGKVGVWHWMAMEGADSALSVLIPAIQAHIVATLLQPRTSMLHNTVFATLDSHLPPE